MPVYVYEYVLPNGESGESFEIVQRMSDPTLAIHPENGRPIRRVYTPPNVTGMWTDMAAKSRLSEKNLEAKGLTKYVRAESGVYEKKTGKGPDILKAD